MGHLSKIKKLKTNRKISGVGGRILRETEETLEEIGKT